MDFLLWCGTNGVPAAIVFTKADKQSKSKTHQNIQKFLKKMNEIFEEIPDYLITSSETGQGKDDLEEFILDLVKEYESREVI